jgi:hypothetical protein
LASCQSMQKGKNGYVFGSSAFAAFESAQDAKIAEMKYRPIIDRSPCCFEARFRFDAQARRAVILQPRAMP